MTQRLVRIRFLPPLTPFLLVYRGDCVGLNFRGKCSVLDFLDSQYVAETIEGQIR